MPAPRRTWAEHSSQSNPKQAQVTHSDIELDVDFDTHVLSGHVEHTVAVKEDGVRELQLDTREVAVSGVTVDGQPAEFALGEPHAALGSRLTVQLPAGLKAGDTVKVGITFAASPQASAVQWLPPEQTAGKQHPYLFTQCQAIHARSILPCQDSPGSKFTYTAAVRVPAELRALMSAVPEEDAAAAAGCDSELPHASQKQRPGTKVYRFKQSVPIPSYLLALAVGHLESRPLGPISAVWSEPEMVEAGAHEFAETAKFLETAEEIAGPYLWGRYDLLLLPPSFPYGGMENPCLTFVTPTLLAGDRSLANVVAHEIAHSWTGNLVTNSSWESFWLNEGFTVFLERKILGRLYGEQMYSFQASLGWLDLQDAVKKEFGETHKYTALVPDLSGGIDPDDCFSSIPYEKGFALIHYLQELVGGSAVFEPFFKSYIQRFKDSPLNSDDFKAFFCDYFKDMTPCTFALIYLAMQIDWDTWYYAPGMPPVTNRYDENLGKQAYELAKKWHTSDVMGIGSNGPAEASAGDLSDWSSTQIVAFLDKLAELRALQPLHPSVTRKMDELYQLDGRTNSEIRSSWLLLCINAGDDSVLPLAKEFLTSQGRMKFLRPIYRALHNSKSSAANQLALETYQAHKQSYHPIASKMVAATLRFSIAAPAGSQRRQGGQRPLAAARPLQAGSTCSPRAAASCRRRAEPEGTVPAQAADSSSSSRSAADAAPETVFYEGSGAPAELALSLLLGIFVITLPLTIASVGRRLWIKYKFTNKRLIVTTNSPLLQREVQVSYDQIKEIRTAPRAFGLWGDMVVFLKDGSRLELAGLERFQDIVDYIEAQRRKL
ncbi:leukotriene A-4 hydrolase isoform X1 isoform B [Chlorella sorokiniana]|uniref:Leucine aminopeptidase n=1 Tax=Chlorella sorokiniana TaxID=3076 RepID=A0A2P6TL59_CHLSO|nr:leukotriene A-4 hydrolase isoform X1 isoform B [Chlorella sorokiniana]|eukprot:PRW45014.1 leukotriene A-4 hydrolase isoform X1 isoform B [Chlorella sorokiniana]